MNCPVCDAKLRPIEKYGVEVDICPDCKGVWLDRGELDKILEMAAAESPTAQPSSDTREASRSPRDEEDHHRDRPQHDDHREHGPDLDPRTGKPRRKSSWLSDILGGLGGEGGD